jgi:hypothetical protein
MAMIARRDLAVLVPAAAFALGLPVALLLPGAAPAPAPQRVPPPLTAAQRPPLAAAYDRALFGAATAAETALPGDAPALVGIVGRLGGDAVALVRTSEGATRALRQGDSVDGWTLASLAIDAAFFTRGAQQVRVPLPDPEN